MSILKIAPGRYVNPDAVERVTSYIISRSIAYGGMSVIPENAVAEMLMVKEVFGQTGGKQIHHFVLSFSDWESEKIRHINELVSLAYDICYYFGYDYQIIFGVHRENGGYHIHFAVNSVNYRTGKKLTINNEKAWNLSDYILSCFPYEFAQRLKVHSLTVYFY